MKLRALPLVAFLCLFVGVSLLPAADDSQEARQKELAKFEGTWKFVSIEVEGTKVPDQQVQRSGQLVLQGDHFTLKEEGATHRGTFKLDLTKKPKQIDVSFTAGPEKGKTSLGIYELEGDTYKVCIGLAGKERPTEFATKPDSGHVLEVLKRVKDSPENSETTRKERKLLAGTWTCVSSKRDGNPTPAGTVDRLKLVLTSQKYATYRGDELLFEGGYTLAPTVQPKEMDIIATGGEDKGKTAKGIYSLEGDTLKLCYTMPGKARPKAFESKPGSGAALSTWKRLKP